MKNKRKMLVIGLSRNRAGVETYILNLVKGLSSDKFELYFPANGAEETYGDELLRLGHRFIRIPTARGRHFISFYREWNRIFREHQFDVVYMNDCDIAHIHQLKLARKYGVPVRIFHAHNSSWMGDGPSLMNRCLAIWNKLNLNSIANKLLACSKESAEWMFPSNSSYQIIRNAVDVSKFSFNETSRAKIRGELGIGEVPLVGFVGRFDSEKNPEYFVRVFSEIKKILPNAFAVMVGDGESRTIVERTIEECGLSDECIKLLGVRHDIPDLMSALDCLVMTSKVEGFPFVLVEAQASGLSSIVSDVVPKETNLTGLLNFVSLDSAPDWISAISQALKNDVDRGTYGDVLSKQGYDIKNEVFRLEQEILNELEG